jgi:acetyl esterase/lipase
MSFTGKFMVPGSRLLKLVAYDRKRHRLRGLKMVNALSKLALRSDPEVDVEKTKLCGLDTGVFTPKTLLSDRVLLYLHGGGYAVCSWETHRSMIEAICKYSGMKCYAINYRMAPKHPFPAAVEDAAACLIHLMDEFGPEKACIGGDSAGGGLAFAALLKLKELGKPMPVKAFAFSPWLDLSVPMFDEAGDPHEDPMLDPQAVKVWAERYLNGYHNQHPLASPLYGDTKNLPSFLIHVGEREMLLDEAVNFTAKARESGVDAHLRIFPDMVHVFQLMHMLVPEARESLKEVSEFIRN